MSDLKSRVNYKINKLYDSSTLFQKYGLDVWITTTIIIVLLFLIGYYYIMNHLHSLRHKWVKIRCNPLYMPFAGYINKDKNLTNFESTFTNFTYCLKNIIEVGTKEAVEPIHFLLNNVTKIFTEISNTFNIFRKMLDYLRKVFEKIYSDVITRIVNICIPLLMIFVKLKDSFAKLIGILTTSMFAYLLEYRLIKIFIINYGTILMLEVFVPMLATYISIMLTAFAEFPIPFVGIPMGMQSLVILGIVLAVPLIIVFTFLMILILFGNQVYYDINQSLPPRPPAI